MAVYTKISSSFLHKTLKNFQIGDLINYSGIKEGIENTNYFIETTKGKFILTIFEKRVQDNDIPFFINLMNHLSMEKFLCPHPIKDKNNEFIQKINYKKFIIVSFLEGSWKKLPNNQDCFLVGKVIADLHKKTKDFNFIRKNSLSISGWKKLINAIKVNVPKDNINKIDKNLLNDINESFLECSNNWPNNLPKGLIHGDIFPDNIFFKNKKISGVIDFYFACTDIRVYEIAIALNAWCFDKNFVFDIKKAKNLIKGYHSQIQLSNTEIRYLPLLGQAAALRFLLTRLYDWFNTSNKAFITKKDPKEYLYKLRFFRHNLKIKNNDLIII